MSLLLLSLLACMESALSEDNAIPARGFSQDYELRIDVWPAASEDVESLPQSFFDVAFDSESMWTTVLQLQAPITLRGELTGFAANPTAVGVPGQDTQVQGFMQAMVPGTPMERLVATDAAGFFEAQVVPSSGYTVALIPALPSQLPFLVSEDQELLSHTDLSTYLDYGLPVWGRVDIAHSGWLSQGVARLIHTETGVAGPTAPIKDGRYLLRAYPGDYTLQIFDPDDSYIPVVERELSIGLEQADGIEENISLPGLARVVVSGEVRDPEGALYPDVEVRFTSVSLTGLSEGSLTLSSTTNESGLFIAQLLPGNYTVEYLPPYGDDTSPGEQVDLDLSVSTEIPSQSMVPLEAVQAYVYSNGLPAGDTLIRAQEVGFDGRVFETTASDDGYFVLPVSLGSLEWTFTPSLGIEAATTFAVMSAEEVLEAGSIALDEGVLLEGEVRYEGSPLPFSIVDVRDQDDTLWAQTVTNEDGWFSVRVSTQLQGTEQR